MNKLGIFFFVIVIIAGCGISGKTTHVSEKAFKINIEAGEDNRTIDLKAVASFANDTSFINIFGPLGLNISKIWMNGDSIILVDLFNKKVIESVYPNASTILKNFFEGKLDKKGQIFFNSVLKYLIRASGQYQNPNTSEGTVDFKNGFKKKYIYLKYGSGSNSFYANLTVRKDNSVNSINFDKRKYLSFNKSVIYLK